MYGPDDYAEDLIQQQATNYVRQNKGQVTATSAATRTVTVTVGGDTDTEIAGVKYDANYIPQVGDVVLIHQTGPGDLRVTGRVNEAGSANVFAGFQSAFIGTTETTTSSTYGNLTTPGPQVGVTIGPSGVLLVGIFCGMGTASGTDGAVMSFSWTGVVTTGASDVWSIYMANISGQMQFGGVFPFGSLPPGAVTLQTKYRTTVNTHTAAFANRYIWVLPL